MIQILRRYYLMGLRSIFLIIYLFISQALTCLFLDVSKNFHFNAANFTNIYIKKILRHSTLNKLNIICIKVFLYIKMLQEYSVQGDSSHSIIRQLNIEGYKNGELLIFLGKNIQIVFQHNIIFCIPTLISL